MMGKRGIQDLALFGSEAVFTRPRSTSNLVRPDFDAFLAYSQQFFTEHWYSNSGPLSKQLEHRLAEFHEVEYCAAVSSGFWGLVLSMKALGLSGKSEVILPSFTYRRLADAVTWAGFIPHFCEVDSHSLGPSPSTIEACLNDQTAMIVATHPIVNCCDAHGLSRLATDLNLPLLFDSVESTYETCAGQRVGSFGNAELFSLHASKLINGFEGGYITTNDPDLIEQLALLRGFGFEGQDNITTLGINAKLNEIHAAMALASLDDVDDQVERNYARYAAYQQQLKNIPGVRLVEFDVRERSGFKNIVVELLDSWPTTRQRTLDILVAEGMLARAYYSPPLHVKPASYSTIFGDLSQTEELSERFVVLPSGHFVTLDDIAEIAIMLTFIVEHAHGINAAFEKS